MNITIQINEIPTYTFLILAIHTTGCAFRKTFVLHLLLCKAASKSIVELLTVSCSVWGWKKAKKTHHTKYSEWNIELYFVFIISKYYFNGNWFWQFGFVLKICKLIFELDIGICMQYISMNTISHYRNCTGVEGHNWKSLGRIWWTWRRRRRRRRSQKDESFSRSRGGLSPLFVKF